MNEDVFTQVTGASRNVFYAYIINISICDVIIYKQNS